MSNNPEEIRGVEYDGPPGDPYDNDYDEKPKRGDVVYPVRPRPASRRWPWLLLACPLGCVILLCGCVILSASTFSAGTAIVGSQLDRNAVSESGSETLAVDADQTLTVRVDNNVGDIAIRWGSDDAVQVDYTKRAYGWTVGGAEDALAEVTVDVVQDADSIVIETDAPNSNLFSSLGGGVDIDLVLPPRAAVIVDNSVGEINVTLPDSAHISVDARVEVGEINVSGFDLPDDSQREVVSETLETTLGSGPDTPPVYQLEVSVGQINIDTE